MVLPAGLRVRPPHSTDAEQFFDLVAASDVSEVGYVDYEIGDAVEELTRTDVDRAADAWLILRGEQTVGYAVVAAPTPAATEPIAEADLYVHPSESDEVFTHLLDRVRRRAAEQSPASRAVTMWAPYTSQSRTARLLAADGWRPVRRFARMTIDLAEAPPPPDPPAGWVLRSGDAAPEPTVHAVVTEAFAEHFATTPRPFPDWLAREQARPGYDRALWLLAEVDGEAAGCLVGRHMSDQGWVQHVGVLPSFRGRGIARWLVLNAFQRLAAAGHPTAALGVDVENVTGALRLYESCGMRLGTAHDCYRLELTA